MEKFRGSDSFALLSALKSLILTLEVRVVRGVVSAHTDAATVVATRSLLLGLGGRRSQSGSLGR